jgi:hypothetical protein
MVVKINRTKIGSAGEMLTYRTALGPNSRYKSTTLKASEKIDWIFLPLRFSPR